MSRACALLWLQLFCLPLSAQVPLTVSEPHAADCEVAACATPTELRLELCVAAGFHAYTADVGGGGPVSLELDPECDFVAAGAVVLPPADAGKVTGRAVWRLPIRAKTDGGGGELRATAWLQVCDELQCNAPERIELVGRPGDFAVLLVSDARDERSARLAAFLRGRGMQVTVTTYPEVTAELCERHQVALCDSKRFRQTAKVMEHVHAFPRTSTPIVAVGFFGTELVEKHGVAMTSGYI
ncbi:MAG: hypothetical protein KAI24_12820 [Planctomycetes bacterium]|nr:hypothetical protein [Planctomycetota bacterium]